MKKIINWFKKRPMNKAVIVVSFVSFIANVAVGYYINGVTFLMLSLSWIVVEAHAYREEMLEENLGLSNEIRCDLTLLVRYFHLRYTREKLTADFCKHMMDGNEYIRKLQAITDKIERCEKELKNEPNITF